MYDTGNIVLDKTVGWVILMGGVLLQTLLGSNLDHSISVCVWKSYVHMYRATRIVNMWVGWCYVWMVLLNINDRGGENCIL